MKQTKHFKRTAFNLSAKSMVSTLLLLIAMLLPQGAWATDFISEVKISSESGNNGNNAKSHLTNNNYTLAGGDLNYGNGKDSWFIYLGYKKDTDASKAITGIMIVSGKDYQSDDYLEGGTKTLSYDGKTWYRSPAQGAADLNKGASGDYLTIFYTRDGNTVNGGKPLVSLSVAEETGLSGYTYAGLYKDGAFSANGNTNQGAKGDARYITYTTHTHAYTAAFNWADDGKSCTATTNCAGCGDTHSNLACTVTSAPKSGAAATCTENGWTTYTAEVTSNGKNFSATKDVQDIAALGHGSTGYNDSYSWTGNAYNDASQDTKACTFTLTCRKCSTKVVNGASLTCTKTAHVDATCRATGSTTYQATGSYTSSNSAYNYSATKTNVYTIAALGHGSTGYTESYVWTGNAYNDWSQDTKACIFTLTCKNCSTKVVNGASLTCIRTAHVDATCRATGSTTYQATGSYTAANSAYNYSATKTHEYPIAALGHSYGAGAWSWADDGHSATCTRTCGRTNCYTNIPGHTSSKSVTLGNGITSEQQVAPKCTEMGTTRYTATATVENVEYRDTKDIKDIPATGLHTFDDVTDPHHTLCTVCDHSFFRYTSSTEEAVDPYDADELKDAYDAKLDFTNTYVDGQGVMEFKGTLKTIGDNAFLDCSGFTGNLTIPNSVTSIGRSAFLRCSGFTGNLTIPNSVTSIGDYAFEKCSGLKGNLTIPNSVTSIGVSAFNNCSGFTGNLTIPNSVTSIGGYAFDECYGFNGNLTIPNSVTSIGYYAFSGCRGFIGDLTIPNSVTSIESSAFEGCFRFNGNLTIANSVTSIGDYAFSGCSGFTGVEFQSVPQIGGSRTFDNVTNNKTVVLSDNSYVYKGDNPYFPAVQSATYTRTGIRNQWGTIVVPFDVNGSGADYDLYKLDQVYDFELTLTKVNGTLAAGTPALIRLHDDFDGDYSLTLTASNTTVSGQLNDGSEANGLQLVGTYETQELENSDYFISNNKFWNVGDMTAHGVHGVKTAPFRAYLKSTWAGARASSLSISIADEDVNGIQTLNAITDGDAEYYDMNGRRINSLQKGVNIVKMSNGKTIKVNIK